QAIQNALQHLLKILNDNKFMHGDLWPINIMLQVDAKGKLVVNFDWAGKTGKVFYLKLRNQDISWPGE
ncbi:uncharacterized protein LAESUDRAFT_634275, partial [Laetiporus sulphureus 93-53]